MLNDLVTRNIRNYENSNNLILKMDKKKWAKYLNKHFSKEDIQMTNKHEKICSKSLVIKKCKLKSQCSTTIYLLKYFKKHKQKS